ncbi:Krueppel c2h2-type zinc finger protein, partial [Operophtera brumata]
MAEVRVKKNRHSVYSLVSCSDLTPGSLDVWVDLPEAIKYDPLLAPFKLRYEEQHGDDLTPGSLDVWVDLPEAIKYDPLLAPFKLRYEEQHDSTTEIKQETVLDDPNTQQNGTNEVTDEYDCKEFLEIYTDFKHDSDEEPLSKKVKERKSKKKSKKEKHTESNTDPKSEIIEPSSQESNEDITLSVANGESNDSIKVSVTSNDCNDFELVLLTKEQQMEEVLSRKESSNYQNSVYKCEYCFKGFMTELTFKNHMVRHDL